MFVYEYDSVFVCACAPVCVLCLCARVCVCSCVFSFEVQCVTCVIWISHMQLSTQTPTSPRRIRRLFAVLQCVAVRCSALQCVVVCCSVLQCVAVCCSVLQSLLHSIPMLFALIRHVVHTHEPCLSIRISQISIHAWILTYG